jgi:mono/diheme cytochrome c family protein
MISAGIGAFALSAAMAVSPAAAQEGDPEVGASAWRSGECKDCHGWAGDGVPENNQSAGPNLRESLLSAEQMVEVIRCGRPGTDMPSFRRNAWTDIIPCYGMTAPLEGAMAPNFGGRMIGDRTINGLVAFIMRDFVGQGPVSREYCVEVIGADSSRCDAYPTEAEIEAAEDEHGG